MSIAQHIISDPAKGFTFMSGAKVVTIHDGRGKVVWQVRDHLGQTTLHWDGKDETGQRVLNGNYLCKIIYWTGETVYVPFVFL